MEACCFGGYRGYTPSFSNENLIPEFDRKYIIKRTKCETKQTNCQTAKFTLENEDMLSSKRYAFFAYIRSEMLFQVFSYQMLCTLRNSLRIN